MSKDSIIRRKFIFDGRVQGVGFRWRARMAAEELGLTGWVKNEWDDSVVMEVQGPSEKIDMLIQGLQQARYIRINHIFSVELPVDPRENKFKVKSSY